MKSKLATFAIVFLFSLLVVFHQGLAQTRSPEPSPSDTVAQDIPGVIKGGTKIQVVVASVPGHGAPGITAKGTEGPIALPDGSVVFCNTIFNLLNKVDKDGNVSTFVDEAQAHRPTGLSWDPKGRLIAATQGEGYKGIRVVFPKEHVTQLSDNFEGTPFVAPNDLVVDKKGGVYFTDPAKVYKKDAPADDIPNPSMPPAVYYLPPNGNKVIRVAERIDFPNGVTISPDGKILYINDTEGWYIIAFDIREDGSLRNRRNFGKYQDLTVTTVGRVVGGGDGMTVDSAGRIYTAAANYAATGGSVQVFSPKGELLGKIQTSRSPQNLAFGGPDMKVLYVVGGGSVFKMQMLAQGIKSRGGK